MNKQLIRRVLEISREYNHSHLPGALSALPIIQSILGNDWSKAHDVFILSKGHAAVALYAVLESMGYAPDVRKTHPERDPVNGITCTTGSLGHGLPIAVGIAYGKMLRREPGQVHVLMGDGECAEGTTWEALNLAEYLKLRNLWVHIDGNESGALGKLPYNTCRHVLSFERVFYHGTKKGEGVSFLEGCNDHKRVLTDEEFERAMEELKD